MDVSLLSAYHKQVVLCLHGSHMRFCQCPRYCKNCPEQTSREQSLCVCVAGFWFGLADVWVNAKGMRPNCGSTLNGDLQSSVMLLVTQKLAAVPQHNLQSRILQGKGKHTLLKSKQQPPARLPFVGSSSTSFLSLLPVRSSIISYTQFDPENLHHSLLCNMRQPVCC